MKVICKKAATCDYTGGCHHTKPHEKDYECVEDGYCKGECVPLKEETLGERLERFEARITALEERVNTLEALTDPQNR